jgi:hypothetical protein
VDYAAYYSGAQWTQAALENELAKWMAVLDAAQMGGRDRSISGPDGMRVDLDLVKVEEIRDRISAIQDALAAINPTDSPVGAVRLILPTFGGIPH